MSRIVSTVTNDMFITTNSSKSKDTYQADKSRNNSNQITFDDDDEPNLARDIKHY